MDCGGLYCDGVAKKDKEGENDLLLTVLFSIIVDEQ